MAPNAQTLRIEFATEESFEGEYKRNIANGGIFIATRSDYAVRDPVTVEVSLGYSGRSISLEGEVVHRVPPGMAETGATPGVAVQFSMSARELRGEFDKLADVDPSVDERATGSGRRVAPRTTARVVAVLETDAEPIEGRTRNLSTSGALVGVDGKPPRVGQPVTVRVTHPTTGEKVGILSRVARHLTDPHGVVTGVGVQFEPPEASRVELESFISEVKAAEHSRRLGGISGPISELGIENLLQMFGKCSPQGTLTLSNGPHEGELVFESGLLRRVALGSVSGQAALGELLGWREGSFEFQASIAADDFDEEPLPLEAAILAALRVQDEDGRPASEVSDANAASFDDVSFDAAFEDVADETESDAAPEDAVDTGAVFDDPADTDAGFDDVSFDDGESDNDSDADEAVDSSVVDDILGDIDIDLGDDIDAVDVGDADVGDANGAPGGGDLVLPLEATLVVDPAAADDARTDLDKTEEAVLDLALVSMTVSKVFAIIPEPEVEVRAALEALVRRGVVRLDY